MLVVLVHELNTYSIEQIFTKHLNMSAGNLGAIDITMKQNKIKTDKYSYCLGVYSGQNSVCRYQYATYLINTILQ